MNLIEQLGGYEAAKGLFNLYEYSISFKYYKVFKGDFESAGYIDVFIPDLQKALLEYRRQHNIFEVGDKVVYRDLPHERLFSVRFVGDDEIVVYELWDEMGAKTFTEKHPYSDIDHATDAEIKAGKRLEVKSEN